MATATKDASTTKGLQRQLSEENTPESPVVRALRQQVANAVLLYLNYKHYHWQTQGPHFRDLHKLFDEFADEVLESLDPLAERVRMIGQNPLFHTPVDRAFVTSGAILAPVLASFEAMMDDIDSNAG